MLLSNLQCNGQQCTGNEGSCCTNSKMSWFLKTLTETTTEDIEVRVCGDEGLNDEDTPLDIIFMNFILIN